MASEMLFFLGLPSQIIWSLHFEYVAMVTWRSWLQNFTQLKLSTTFVSPQLIFMLFCVESQRNIMKPLTNRTILKCVLKMYVEMSCHGQFYRKLSP